MSTYGYYLDIYYQCLLTAITWIFIINVYLRLLPGYLLPMSLYGYYPDIYYQCLLTAITWIFIINVYLRLLPGYSLPMSTYGYYPDIYYQCLPRMSVCLHAALIPGYP